MTSPSRLNALRQDMGGGLLRSMRDKCGITSPSNEDWEYNALKLKLLGYAISSIGEYMSSDRPSGGVPSPRRELIESFPGVEHGIDTVEWFPLHWAAAGFPTILPRDVELLLQQNPMSCRLPSNTSSQMLPIHVLSCNPYPNLDIAAELIAAYPFSVMQTDADGFLPLHFAAQHTVSVPYLQILLQENSTALYQLTQRQQTCLHLAIDNPCTAILEALLSVWPEGSREQPLSNKQLDSPFFYAIRKENDAAVATMIAKDTTLTRLLNSANQFPLHFAARFSNLAVVSVLLKADPNVAFMATASRGSFPLHEAVHSPCEDVLSLLVEATPCIPPMEYVRAHSRMLAAQEDQEIGQGEIFEQGLLSEDESEGDSLHSSEGSGVVVPPLQPTASDTRVAMTQWLQDADQQHPIHALMKSVYLSKSRVQLLLLKYASHYEASLCNTIYTEGCGHSPVLYARSFLLLMQDSSGNTPLHTFINAMLLESFPINGSNSVSSSPSLLSPDRLEAFKCALYHAPAACFVLNQDLELPLHRFAYVIDKLLGCCSVSGSADKSSGVAGSPRRKKKHIRRDHACEMMRLLLRHTTARETWGNSRLPNHLVARRDILNGDGEDYEGGQRGARLEHSFLFQDISGDYPQAHDDQPLHLDGEDEADRLLLHLKTPDSSLLEFCNNDNENIFDLLTRSSVTVHISHSFSGVEPTADDIVENCNAPAHQDEILETETNTATTRHEAASFEYSPPVSPVSSPTVTSPAPSRFKKSGAIDSVSPPLNGPSQLCTRSLLKRQVLQAHPKFNQPLLFELNYRARRMALFLGFCAGTISTASKKREVNIFAKLRRVGNGELFVIVISYL